MRPIKHRNIICQPLIGPMDLERYLGGVELFVVGGESGRSAKPLDYAWVISIREQYIRQGIHFEFRQRGTHFIKDGKLYTPSCAGTVQPGQKSEYQLVTGALGHINEEVFVQCHIEREKERCGVSLLC